MGKRIEGISALGSDIVRVTNQLNVVPVRTFHDWDETTPLVQTQNDFEYRSHYANRLYRDR
jgi:hypothetical protein